ncbi:hypothetical protein M427DRAFT_335028 [Gonapodya prolifera JEL478]|uniref:Uncharacterized protein n=1 Tax=Gonapodya prolifera (strain JEL478) TaxID=1344416 RepID=A0A139ADJ1_GONPJ|nr:hypothetical protein M427DRAFT_335028 [Gonapodya prolifera JEL478]|eukprot:KXS14837.1 hypothetical protein M427DRAFT_335028 [Gonapodya prolifera JEL478]
MCPARSQTPGRAPSGKGFRREVRGAAGRRWDTILLMRRWARRHGVQVRWDVPMASSMASTPSHIREDGSQRAPKQGTRQTFIESHSRFSRGKTRVHRVTFGERNGVETEIEVARIVAIRSAERHTGPAVRRRNAMSCNGSASQKQSMANRYWGRHGEVHRASQSRAMEIPQQMIPFNLGFVAESRAALWGHK